jgi:Collagen triple helix repeat (20 copies)
MFLRVCDRVTFVNVLLVFVLVFVMGGGAYAAKRYLITSTKQISPKVLSQLRGRTGPGGPAGASGLNGAGGKDGLQGLQGLKGDKGDKGDAGLPGVEGKEGSPWTAGGVLPSGKTEKGDWAIFANVPGGGPEGVAVTTVSFNIPLAVAPEPVYVKAPTEEERSKGEFPPAPAGCIGNAEEPGAEKGHLCVFPQYELNTKTPTICSAAKGSVGLISCVLFQSSGVAGTADPSGALIGAIAKEAGFMALNGTWAVTAE